MQAGGRADFWSCLFLAQSLLLPGSELPQVLSKAQKSFLVKSLMVFLMITQVRNRALNQMVTKSPDCGFWNLIPPDPSPFSELCPLSKYVGSTHSRRKKRKLTFLEDPFCTGYLILCQLHCGVSCSENSHRW